MCPKFIQHSQCSNLTCTAEAEDCKGSQGILCLLRATLHASHQDCGTGKFADLDVQIGSGIVVASCFPVS